MAIVSNLTDTRRSAQRRRFGIDELLVHASNPTPLSSRGLLFDARRHRSLKGFRSFGLFL